MYSRVVCSVKLRNSCPCQVGLGHRLGDADGALHLTDDGEMVGVAAAMGLRRSARGPRGTGEGSILKRTTKTLWHRNRRPRPHLRSFDGRSFSSSSLSRKEAVCAWRKALQVRTLVARRDRHRGLVGATQRCKGQGHQSGTLICPRICPKIPEARHATVRGARRARLPAL